MGDRTVTDRMKRQRELRAAEGWQKVTVWVPTLADAEDVKKLAAERRARAEALAGLSEEVPKVNVDTAERIARAIAEHGSKAYITPSGAVLELMKELAKEDDLESFASAFVIIARAKANQRKIHYRTRAGHDQRVLSAIAESKGMRWANGAFQTRAGPMRSKRPYAIRNGSRRLSTPWRKPLSAVRPCNNARSGRAAFANSG